MCGDLDLLTQSDRLAAWPEQRTVGQQMNRTRLDVDDRRRHAASLFPKNFDLVAGPAAVTNPCTTKEAIAADT